jgi:hypothetical protein
MSIVVQFTTAELSTDLQEAIAGANAFLAQERGLRGDHAWLKRCVLQRFISKYLRSDQNFQSRLFAVELATIAAQAYSECGDTSVDSFIFPSAAEAKNIKARADGLAESINDCRWLPVEATTTEFKNGLDILRNVYPCKRTKGENNKGDPRRRAFIVRLAEKFQRSFRDIPISSITELTSFGWPDIGERAVRLVLTSERQREIADQVETAIKQEGTSEALAIGVMNRLARREILDIAEGAQQVQLQFKDENVVFRAAISRLAKLDDSDLARAAIDALLRVAEDFGVTVESSPEKSGSEIIDF